MKKNYKTVSFAVNASADTDIIRTSSDVTYTLQYGKNNGGVQLNATAEDLEKIFD